MEYLRRTVNSGILIPLFDLPTSLLNRDVEVIILPVDDKKSKTTSRKSAKGCLNKYANPALILNEKDAWANAVRENYADS